MKSMISKFAIYPFLFGSFFVLYLYSYNVGKLYISETFSSFGLVFITVLILLIVFRLVYWNWYKASVVTTFWIFFIYSFGHIARYFQPDVVAEITFAYIVFVVFWFIVMIAVVFLFKKGNFDYKNMTLKLNIISIVMFFIPIVQVVFVPKDSVEINNLINEKLVIKQDTDKGLSNQPDVYYLIFDRYASGSVLKSQYNFDNEEFLTKLENKGFFVAKNSTANYLKTVHSLASSLNMVYLDEYLARQDKNSSSILPLYSLLKDYKIWRYFKAIDYEFVHFGGWWEPTRINSFADKNINTYGISEFSNVFYQTTYLFPLTLSFNYENTLKNIWSNEKEVFHKISLVAGNTAKTYTFAHILLPHPPFIFDENGNFVVSSDSDKEAYIRQLKYTNTQVLGLVDSIIKFNPNSIIVIQSDEGPHPSRYAKDELSFKWEDATQNEIEEKMRILYAVYFPDQKYDDMYPSITPVNTFRIIFNNYFGFEEMPILEDKNYIFSDYYHPYQITEITEKLKNK